MQRAFSLLEVMVVVAIIGIVSAIAVPGISEQVRRTRDIGALEGIRQTILEARNEARLRRGCAIVEGVDDAGGGHFRGLVVKIDVNCDGIAESTSRAVEVGDAVFFVNFSGFFTQSSIKRLTFEAQGNLKQGEAGAIVGFVNSAPFRRFRVVPAIGAVRQEVP